jgi:Tol biopolymer transport system component
MRVPLESIAAAVLVSIAIAGFAQYDSATPKSSVTNSSHLALRSAVSAQNSDVIVYERAPENSDPWPIDDIHLVNADGTNDKALTHDGHSHSPSWSPDGEHILFIHDAALQTELPFRENEDAKTHHAVELYVMDRDGGNPRLVQRMEPLIVDATWSPDGKSAVIQSAKTPPNSPRGSYLYLVSVDGRSEPRLLFPYRAANASWSPDGKKLLFSRKSETDCPLPDNPTRRAEPTQRPTQPCVPWTQWIANADGSNAVPFIDANSTGDTLEFERAWSPDGKQIVFAATDGPNYSAHSSQIYVMNEDGSGMRQLTNDPAWQSCRHPSWSADGRQITFSCTSSTAICLSPINDAGLPIMPWCVVRLFVISPSDPPVHLTPLAKNDGRSPSFAPK